MSRLRAFFGDTAAAAAAEFALILPVALLFLLGTIDVGRYFWTINKLEKGVQIGARFAVTTKVVPTSLNSTNYVGFNCGGTTLKAGDTICRDALGTIVCTKGTSAVTCTCTASAMTGSCPSNLSTVDTAAFNAIVARIKVVAPMVDAEEVKVAYAGSGIGYAGDPHKDSGGNALSQVSPIVTVQVIGQRMRAISLLGYGLQLPSFQYSETLEDGEGAIAY